MNIEKPSSPVIPEWAAILAMTLVAAAIRSVGLGRLGIDHFDEGIYAAAGTWSLRPSGLAGIDPGLIPYAPPGYPTLVGLAYAILGPSDFAAIAVSILAAVATIPVVGLVGRRTFGPGGGAAASVFATVSGLHITFSRMALTDATLLLTWIAAIALGGRFLERPGPGRAVAMGLAVGLAQLVKYNGWLVGAIIAATAVVGILVSREDRSRRHLARTFGWGLLAVVVAGLVSWPWFRFVEAHGGYEALLAHQRGYLGGISDWPRHLATQLRQAIALGGLAFPGTIAFGLAFVTVGLSTSGEERVREGLRLVLVATVGLVLFAPATSGWWLGLALVPWMVRDENPRVRLVATWWIALTALTPFYHPYARLWLPLEAAGWMMQASIVLLIVERLRRLGSLASGRSRFLPAAIVVVLGMATIQSVVPRPAPRPLEGILGPRDSLRVATFRLVADLPPGVSSVALLGRPSLRFYVANALASRRVDVRILSNLDELETLPPDAWAIVDMAQVRQEGRVVGGQARLPGRWRMVTNEPTTLSPATLLDVDPAAAVGVLSARSAPLILLRRSPEATAP